MYTFVQIPHCKLLGNEYPIGRRSTEGGPQQVSLILWNYLVFWESWKSHSHISSSVGVRFWMEAVAFHASVLLHVNVGIMLQGQLFHQKSKRSGIAVIWVSLWLDCCSWYVWGTANVRDWWFPVPKGKIKKKQFFLQKRITPSPGMIYFRTE